MGGGKKAKNKTERMDKKKKRRKKKRDKPEEMKLKMGDGLSEKFSLPTST